MLMFIQRSNEDASFVNRAAIVTKRSISHLTARKQEEGDGDDDEDDERKANKR